MKYKHVLALTFMAVFTHALYAADDKSQNNSPSITATQSSGEVTFSGEHVGMTFSGVFNKWSSRLVLPPANSPKIMATFDLSSAKTGDSTYDATLPEGDWFDVDNHPTGTFESTDIELGDNQYQIAGTLALKGKTLPISFVLVDKGKYLYAEFAIDRIEYGIGLDSDPDAEWVSREIKMTLSIRK